MCLAIAFMMAGLVCVQGGQVEERRRLFSRNCSFCRGADGRGGERGPDITMSNLDSRTDLPVLIRNGLPGRGMPGTSLLDSQVGSLVTYLRSIARSAGPPPALMKGRGPTAAELTVPPEGSWPHYNGTPSGNRYSPLQQINLTNVQRLRTEWMFPIPGSARLEVTPVVFDGVMFITAPNEAFALNAETGRQIWRFRRNRTKGVAGDAGGGINRGWRFTRTACFSRRTTLT